MRAARTLALTVAAAAALTVTAPHPQPGRLAVTLPVAAADPVPMGQVPTPQERRASQWYLDKLGITAAQKVTTGQGVRVCLIENGVDQANPDLKGVRWGTVTRLGPAKSTRHGTVMASILAGQGRPGFWGVAPGITLDLAQNAPMELSRVGPGDPFRLFAAFKACADNGAKVINASFTGVYADDPLALQALAYAQARDVVVVAGSGNLGGKQDRLDFPASAFGVLSVAGTDSSMRGDGGSSWAGFTRMLPGQVTTADTQGVAVTGPSANTAWPQPLAGCEGFEFVLRGADGTMRGATSCGTSVATAAVAGVVALVRAAHPELNAANVVNRVVKTATRPVGLPAGTKLPSPRFGYGIVNAQAAVSADVPLVAENPLGSVYTGSRGVWDRRVVAQRAEPAAGTRLPPTELKDVEVVDPATATARPTPLPTEGTPSATTSPSASAGASTGTPSGVSTAAAPARTGSSGGTPGWVWPAGLGALVLAAAGAFLATRRRGTTGGPGRPDAG